MEILKVENIRASYGKKEVLRGVSFKVEKSDILAIIGPNGAGKSTLLKVIAGFLKPTLGAICLDGKDATASSPHEKVGLGMAYFIQGGRVFPSLTVNENLELGAIGLSVEETDKRIASILEIFYNLKKMEGKRAGLLSGGERQALALGMVLAKNPKILLLDEPSAGLSPKLVKETIGKIKEINERMGTTILLVEQNIGEALRIAKKAIALANGEIILESDEPSKLLSGKELEKIFLGKESEIGSRL
jgi:ABC-type branched-subunit amino acid transport system ATPase component